MGRRSFTRRDFIVAFIGFVIGLSALLLWLSPRVVRPETEDFTLSAVGPLTITFSRPVAPDSLPANFEISPPIDGTLNVSGRQLTFQPDLPFDYGQSYTVSLTPGFQGTGGLPGLVGSTIRFTVREPRLLFLREIDGRSNIWRHQETGELLQLTDEPVGVWDFQATPDGQGVLYSSLEPDGSSDLILRAGDGSRIVMLECPNERCTAGYWQPGGDLIAFERQPLGADGGETGVLPVGVWLLDTSSGALEPAVDSKLLVESGLLGLANHSPRWSADGRYLSFFHPDDRVVLIRDLQGQSFSLVPANMEIMGDWSPDSARLAYSELAFGHPHSDDPLDPSPADLTGPTPELYNHITVVDVDRELATDLSSGKDIDFGRPAWNPDGQTLSVPGGSGGTARQIWTLAVNGEAPWALTDNPSMNHSSLAWSPDGRRLAFMGNNREDSQQGPAVWTMDAFTGFAELIIEDAYLPAWQP